MHQRIEKSVFHAGEYVGYCDGTWKIYKNRSGLWTAAKNDASDLFSARTLDGIGKGLDERANVAVGRMLFRGE